VLLLYYYYYYYYTTTTTTTTTFVVKCSVFVVIACLHLRVLSVTICCWSALGLNSRAWNGL
jgi:hypothetical protein